MGDEGAAAAAATANLMVGNETLDHPAPPSPALVQLADDGPPAVSAAGFISESPEIAHSHDCSLLREQVTVGLQPHLAAAENRVSRALQQVMESIETRLLGALRQAAIDIVENLGKEAGACLVLSERKAAMLDHQLSCTKQQALSMLMRIKQVTDAQISDCELQISVERRRAQEAEAKLFIAQDNNRRLRAELKRKGQLLEELQRMHPAAAQQQGLQGDFIEGFETRKGGSISKSLAGQKQSTSNPGELGTPATSAGLTPAGQSSAKSTVEVQTDNISTQPPMHSLTPHDTYTTTRTHMEVPAIELQLGKSNLQAKEDLSSTAVNGHVTLKELHGSQSNDSASVRGVPENISGSVHESHHSLSEDSHPKTNQVTLKEKGQLPSSFKADLELRSTKDSDEEKSCLTMEALYCNDESMPSQVHLVEEYQSDVHHVDASQLQPPSDGLKDISCGKKLDRETNVSIDCREQLEEDEVGPNRARESLLSASRTPKVIECKNVAVKETREAFVAQEKSKKDGLEWGKGRDSGDKSIQTGSSRTETPVLESPGTQVSRRKRKQGVIMSKFDYSVTDKNSNRLEDEDAIAGAFDLLAAPGVDPHISSRDSRRLMQGARQLFSLAERKRR